MPRERLLLLTAKDAVASRVEGLDAGANDYLVKPFANAELIARVRVQLRGRSSVSSGIVHLEACIVDLGKQVADANGDLRTLSTKEAELLAYLSARPGRSVSRQELLSEVWGYRGNPQTRTIDNTMLRLRSKVEHDPARPRHLLTVHGTGYRFES